MVEKKKEKKKNQQREERRGDFEEWRCPVLYPLSEQRGSHLFSCADLHAAAAAQARGNRGAAKKKRGKKKRQASGANEMGGKQTNESRERWRRSAGRCLDRSVFPETPRVRCQSEGKHPLFKSRAERLSDCVWRTERLQCSECTSANCRVVLVGAGGTLAFQSLERLVVVFPPV